MENKTKTMVCSNQEQFDEALFFYPGCNIEIKNYEGMNIDIKRKQKVGKIDIYEKLNFSKKSISIDEDATCGYIRTKIPVATQHISKNNNDLVCGYIYTKESSNSIYISAHMSSEDIALLQRITKIGEKNTFYAKQWKDNTNWLVYNTIGQLYIYHTLCVVRWIEEDYYTQYGKMCKDLDTKYPHLMPLFYLFGKQAFKSIQHILDLDKRRIKDGVV